MVRLGTAWITVLILAVAGCSGDSSGPDGLTAQDLEGTWAFVLDDEDNPCDPNFNDPYTHYLFPPADLGDATSGPVNIVGVWARSIDRPFEWPATGNINLSTQQVEIHFWWTAPGADPQIELTGTLKAGPGIEGTWTSTGINYSGYCWGTFEATLLE